MTFKMQLPSPDLRKIIHHFEFIEVPERYDEQQTVTILPSFANGIIFICKRKKDFLLTNKKIEPISMQSLGLVPTTLLPSKNYHYGGIEAIRVIFQLGALSLILPLPMNAFTNNLFLVEDLGSDYNTLEEQVMLAESNAERVLHIEAFVRRQLAKAKDQTPFSLPLSPQQWQNSNLKVSELARDVGLGTRQLRRKFDKHIGMSPKMYLRIFRYGQALQLMHRIDRVVLTDIAYQCGYSDQSHFSNEFLEFTEQTPRAFLRQNGKLMVEVDDVRYRGYLIKKGLGTL